MANPAGPGRSAIGNAERDAVLATKLHIPRPRKAFLSRARLLDRLTSGMTQDLVLVCTPAGFGKTSLLADWAGRSRRPVAWLSLDEGDNDPARFWRHVAAALDGACAGIADRVAPLFQGQRPASAEQVAATLVNELSGVDDEVVLLLDDFHLIQAPPVHASLEFLLMHVPASLRLVLTTRADPPLPLARLRARGQLAELRERDLRFTLEETSELLRTAVGFDLAPADVAALEDRTEGWVTGLQLAALSLQGRADPAAFIAGFSGSHRYVLDYLTEEVLARQPEHLVRFLLETSVLERLSGPLCDAVTGRNDSQELLEQVERANLFLVPLDEVRGWWRYHQLFADLLQARLAHEQPDRRPALHAAAAAWSEQHGLVHDAIRHALAAGELLWAARLVERHVDARMLRSEGVTVRRWLQALPVELVNSRPRLCLAQAFVAAAASDVAAIQPALDAAERALTDAPDEPYEPSVGRAASVLANVPAAIALERATLAHLRGDAEQTTAFARRARDELVGDEWVLESVIGWYLAAADWLGGRLAAAERAMTSRIDGWLATGQLTLAAWGYHYLGQVQTAQGRLSAALGTYRQALDRASEPGAPAQQITSLAYVGMAAVLYEWDELDEADKHVSEGIRLCRQFAYTPPLATGLALLAWIRQARGNPDGALAAMQEAERIEPNTAACALLDPTPALRARLLLTQGAVVEVARWVEERGLAADADPSYPHERDYLVLARVLLAEAALERALALLQRLQVCAVAQGRMGSVIEIRALQALALESCGDRAGALTALADALSVGAPEGYLRVFVDEGAAMAALFRALLGARRQERTALIDVPRGYIARLADAFEQAGHPIRPPAGRGAVAAPGMIEPLTHRELEVLQLVAAGAPNRAIAEELVVTLDTVKRHVAHIFDKLGAANRTQAVRRARELGLVS